MSDRRKNLLVELFVEELPPKALKKLGEAFADGARRRPDERRAWLEPSVGGRRRSRRRAGWRCTSTRRAGARRRPARSSHKLMPVSVGLDAAGRADAGAAEEARRRSGADADAVVPTAAARSVDGKARGAVPRQRRAPARRSPTGLQAALDDALAKLPIPKVMSYQLADGWTSVQLRAPGARPGRAARRRGRAGARARPGRRPHDARPPLRGAAADRSSCATPTATPRSCATRAR